MQALNMDGGPILYFTSSFSIIDRFIILYCALVLSELEFTCRNSVTLTEPSKFKIIQTKLAQMCCNRIFCMNTCTLTNYDISTTLNLSTFQPRRRHLAVLFPVNVLVIKFAAPPVLVQSLYAYSLHESETLCLSHSARSVAASSAVSSNIDTFSHHSVCFAKAHN